MPEICLLSPPFYGQSRAYFLSQLMCLVLPQVDCNWNVWRFWLLTRLIVKLHQAKEKFSPPAFLSSPKQPPFDRRRQPRFYGRTFPSPSFC